MRTLLLTNDPVVLSFAQSLLNDAGIEAMVFDQHVSMMEGSIGAFPRRLVVADDLWAQAARVLREADLGEWITEHDGR
jgi:Putative prokaryotic signal transducing protein